MQPGSEPVQLVPAVAIGILLGVLCLLSPWLALGAVAGGIAGVLGLSRPKVLCYLVVAAIALTSGVARGMLLPVLRPNELVLAFSAGIVLCLTLATRQSRLQVGTVSGRGGGYILASVVLLMSGTTLVPGISYLVRGVPLTLSDALVLLAPVQYFILFWLFAVLPVTEADRRRILHWMLICSAVVALVGVLQAARVGVVWELLNRWYPSRHADQAAAAGRVTSLMAAWNVLGIFLAVSLLIGWTALVSRPAEGRAGGGVTLIVSAALCTICLLASGSFAGLVGVVIGIACLAVIRPYRAGADAGSRTVVIQGIGLAAIAVGALVLQPYIEPLVRTRLAYQFSGGSLVPTTLAFRFRVWSEIFWPVIKDNLAWGIQLSIPPSFAWGWTESEYLLLLFSFGLPGLLAHLAWVGVSFGWLLARFRRGDGFTRALAATAIAALMVLTITGLTNEVFTFSGAADYLWIMLGLVAGSGAIIPASARVVG